MSSADDDASVAARAAGAIAHMNADHAEALVDLAAWGGAGPDVTAATMTGLDTHGCDLEAVSPSGRHLVRIPFDPPLRNGGQIRSAMVELTRRARLAR